eukprot:2585941-Rhodomonas_salina.1
MHTRHRQTQTRRAGGERDAEGSVLEDVAVPGTRGEHHDELAQAQLRPWHWPGITIASQCVSLSPSKLP